MLQLMETKDHAFPVWVELRIVSFAAWNQDKNLKTDKIYKIFVHLKIIVLEEQLYIRDCKITKSIYIFL